MKTYFLSSLPCMLTVNGVYFGVCNDFERFADVELTDKLFIQFTPENAQPIGFFLTENIRFSPPQGVDVYLLKDGIALHARAFIPLDTTLRPVQQVQTDGGVATLFFQGELHLSLQTAGGVFIATLPPSFRDCKVEYAEKVFLLHTDNEIAIFNNKAERLLLEHVHGYAIQDGKLRLEIPLCDRLGRVACATYDLQNGCARESFTLRQARTENGETDENSVKEELLAYAFFEGILIGADYACFLSDELQNKASELRSFLGEFIHVTFTDSPYVCGLVKKKKDRLFEVSYFRVSVENGKICDIVTA